MKKELLFLAALCLAAVQAWGQTTVAQGTCGAEAGGGNLVWTLTSDGTLTITGKGEMADFVNFGQPWEDYLADIRTAVVQEGVTSVGNWFLRSCPNLTSLTLPTTEVTIGGQRSPLMIAVAQTTASLYKCFSGECRKIIYPEM